MTTNHLSGASWFKSSYSGSQSACVEVAWLPDNHVGVRDSKNSTGPALVLTPTQWDAFAGTLRSANVARDRSATPAATALTTHNAQR
ncbi:DUF397 domain-containing protein [Nocardia cyriacigeorgica]|uniref:DUF397 domain-containing protein n=1 Tax=Nocardia cyriacigeorgica TaxID=135487 RepID=A0A5R8P7K5_9NOCA|nr:DUF397 domain-containing protein [Nocardia cyriacigeorgica]TLF98858.1 DUF397 domain-containing protein [Nocardia cyriacigeorgica]